MASIIPMHFDDAAVYNHPIALIFHVAFRLAALIVYLLGTVVINNDILVFVIVVLLVAFDFWTVKNVTGRLLVGLRYWNEAKEDGSNNWVFESREPGRPLNAADSRIFWTVLYVTPVIWIVLTFFAIIRLKFFWVSIDVVAIMLSSANLIGFTKCDKDAKAKWAGYAADAMGGQGGGGIMGSIFRQGVTNMVSGFTGGNNSNATPPAAPGGVR